MKFQLSLQHQNRQLVFTVRKAVYFDNLVYQVFSGDQNFILYKRKGIWRSNMPGADEELVSKLAEAVEEQLNESKNGEKF